MVNKKLSLLFAIDLLFEFTVSSAHRFLDRLCYMLCSVVPFLWKRNINADPATVRISVAGGWNPNVYGHGPPRRHGAEPHFCVAKGPGAKPMGRHNANHLAWDKRLRYKHTSHAKHVIRMHIPPYFSFAILSENAESFWRRSQLSQFDILFCLSFTTNDQAKCVRLPQIFYVKKGTERFLAF